MTQPPVPPNEPSGTPNHGGPQDQPPAPPYQPGPQGQPQFPPGQPPFPPGQPPFSPGQQPFPPGPPRRSRGPLLIVVGLALLLVIVIATAVVLIVNRTGNPAAGEATPTARTKPSDPTAVEFRRVLSAAPGSCPTPAPTGTACDDEGMQYKLGKVELDGSNVAEVKAGFQEGSTSYWYVSLNLDPQGAERFRQLTATIAKQGPRANQLAILVHGKVVTAPTVQSEIPGGKVQITGSYTRQTAEELVKKIVG